MKIAHLISHYPLPFVGGAEACVHSLASEQTRKGHMVKVIAPQRVRLPNLPYEVLPLKPKYIRIATAPLIKEFVFLEGLRSYQEKFKFDVWQVTIGYPLGVAAVNLFNRYNIPCLLRCSGEDIQVEPEVRYGVRFHKGPDRLIRENYPKFNGLISIVESITEDYTKIGVPKEKIYYIPNGINKGLFNIEVDRRNVRERLGLDPDKKLILTVGRNHPKKGLRHIPDIIEMLSKKRTDFTWVLIGHNNEAIRRIADQKNMAKFLTVKEIRATKRKDENLLFPDRELVEIYKSADIFVLPTIIEGRSNVIAEAMAAGLPVVSTDVPGVRDMIDDKTTGLLSKKDDIEGMVRNIEELLNDQDLHRNIKRSALSETEDLDWSKIADRYIEAYEDVIKRR